MTVATPYIGVDFSKDKLDFLFPHLRDGIVYAPPHLLRRVRHRYRGEVFRLDVRDDRPILAPAQEQLPGAAFFRKA